MARPFLLLQLSDPHIGADWGEGDPAADLEAAVASVRRLPEPPDASLISGDIANRGGDDQYAAARELLEPLPGPGEDAGELDDERLQWLQDALGEAPDRPTLLALHHPPLVTGIDPWDATALTAEHRSGLARALEQHPQVQLLAAGHVHRAIASRFAGRPLPTVPSTHVQARLKFEVPELELTRQPPAYAIHAVLDGEIVSHLQPVEH